MTTEEKLPPYNDLFKPVPDTSKTSNSKASCPNKTKATRKSRLDWSYWERDILFQKHKELGNKWTKISKYLPNKTENIIKNYFYSSLRKISRKIKKSILPKMSGDKSSLTYDQCSHLLDYLKEMIISDTFPRKSKKKDTYLMEILSSKELSPDKIDAYKKHLLLHFPIPDRSYRSSAIVSFLEKAPNLKPLHTSIQNKFNEVLCFLNNETVTKEPNIKLPEFDLDNILQK
jgi:hypothetical protein